MSHGAKNSAVAVRQKNAQGSFFSGSGGSELPVCINEPLGLASCWNFERRTCQLEHLLACKFLMVPRAGKRHRLFDGGPPPRLRLLHQQFENLISIIGLQKRPEFVHCVRTLSSHPVFCSTLGKPKQLGHSCPCFGRIDRPQQARNLGRRGAQNRRWGGGSCTPQICVSAADGRR